MKFALAQMDVAPGLPGRNVEKMLSMVDVARSEGADLIVFPELCVSGYMLADMWLNESFCDYLMHFNDVIREASRGIAIAYGNVYIDREINKRWNDLAFHPNKDGRIRKYNAVYVVQNGRYAGRVSETRLLPQGVQPKTLFPNYRIFDDERYFFSMEEIAKDAGVGLTAITQPFIIETSTGTKRIGFEVCEDLWVQDYRSNGTPTNPTNILIANGAELIVNISASPWNIGKNESRDRRIRFLKQEAGASFVPFIYVNKTGAQNNGKNVITFDGGTTVYNKAGQPVFLASESFREELFFHDDSVFSGPSVERHDRPAIQQKYDAIIRGIRHLELLQPAGQPLRFVLGLSGGIDSAVVASLLTLVAGKENVLAVNMPSRYNREQTKAAAAQIASNLGIDYRILPIDELADLNRKLFEETDKVFHPSEITKSLSDENIQAKIRGTSVLSNLAGRYGRFLTNNGNKLEIALGYATLYGDVNGAIVPLGDLTKTEVYALGRFLNEHVFQREVIPAYMFPDELFRFDDGKIKPSPELKADQINPMKFGYHCALLDAFTDYLRKSPEDVMQWYLDGVLASELKISEELIVRWGMDNPEAFVSDLEWFSGSIQKNIFKRVQAPPIIITSKSAYGYDIRESMLPYEPTVRFTELKKQVLALKRYESRSR